MENAASDGALRVLVAEDTSSILALLELCLTKAGYQVETAADGKAGLAKFLPGAFDVVILDMRMPVMDGYCAAREIRARESAAATARPVPIIALTANMQVEELERSRAAGCSHFLGKPFEKGALLGLVLEAARGGLAPAAPARLAEHPDPEIADMIPRFLEHRRLEIALMAKALARGDYACVESYGHKTSGSGGSYGFPVISSLGKRIELAAKARDAAAVQLGLNDLEAHLTTLAPAP